MTTRKHLTTFAAVLAAIGITAGPAAAQSPPPPPGPTTGMPDAPPPTGKRCQGKQGKAKQRCRRPANPPERSPARPPPARAS